jgi:hemin uptake protein HemP
MSSTPESPTLSPGRIGEVRKRSSASHKAATSTGAFIAMSAADEQPQRTPSQTERDRPQAVHPIRVLVSEILGGGREAILEHDGQDYRLRITANGKLILTK